MRARVLGCWLGVVVGCAAIDADPDASVAGADIETLLAALQREEPARGLKTRAAADRRAAAATQLGQAGVGSDAVILALIDASQQGGMPAIRRRCPWPRPRR